MSEEGQRKSADYISGGAMDTRASQTGGWCASEREENKRMQVPKIEKRERGLHPGCGDSPTGQTEIGTLVINRKRDRKSLRKNHGQEISPSDSSKRMENNLQRDDVIDFDWYLCRPQGSVVLFGFSRAHPTNPPSSFHFLFHQKLYHSLMAFQSFAILSLLVSAVLAQSTVLYQSLHFFFRIALTSFLSVKCLHSLRNLFRLHHLSHGLEQRHHFYRLHESLHHSPPGVHSRRQYIPLLLRHHHRPPILVREQCIQCMSTEYRHRSA